MWLSCRPVLEPGIDRTRCVNGDGKAVPGAAVAVTVGEASRLGDSGTPHLVRVRGFGSEAGREDHWLFATSTDRADHLRLGGGRVPSELGLVALSLEVWSPPLVAAIACLRERCLELTGVLTPGEAPELASSLRVVSVASCTSE